MGGGDRGIGGNVIKHSKIWKIILKNYFDIQTWFDHSWTKITSIIETKGK